MLCNIIEIRRAMRRKKFLSLGTARPAVGRWVSRRSSSR
jgi:hypothetical protein